MGLARFAFRSINRTLHAFGFRLSLIERDFDNHLLNEGMRQSMLCNLAEQADAWLERQECFEATKLDTIALVSEFYEAYLHSPFRENSGGSRFNNMLWLALIARAYKPDIVIDSGTFQGASAWALKFGAPGAKVLSFDIDLSQLLRRDSDVVYLERDWTTFDLPPCKILAYFDDHLDQVRRLLEAKKRGVDLAIFDDDQPPRLAMTHHVEALPKIEFIFDNALRKEKELVWKTRGKTLRWTVDVAYLDRAREAIAWTDRLPNTSPITGIHQTPYRIVKVRTGH
jgi:hypothetical protein